MTPPKNDNDNEKQKLTNKNTTTKLIAAGIFIGAIITLVILKSLPVQYLSTAGSVDNSTDIGENKPLYWVAPMDANYQRDQPGQSPMGMDLIPYYGSQNNTINDVRHHN